MGEGKGRETKGGEGIERAGKGKGEGRDGECRVGRGDRVGPKLKLGPRTIFLAPALWKNA